MALVKVEFWEQRDQAGPASEFPRRSEGYAVYLEFELFGDLLQEPAQLLDAEVAVVVVIGAFTEQDVRCLFRLDLLYQVAQFGPIQ